MTELANALRGRFVVASLGASGDRDYPLPEALRRATTLIDLDAAADSKITSDYFAHHRIRRVIAGVSGPRTFRQNRSVYCSSILPPRDELIEVYGLQELFEIVALSEVECTSLSAILHETGVPAIDYLKVDLEGEDFNVIRHLGNLLEPILCLQMELRFQPFFEGEPYFHEVVAFLHDRGFDLIGVAPEHWKPVTRTGPAHDDGRTVWADTHFVRRLPHGAEPLVRAKQIIACALMGGRTYAQHLFERAEAGLPSSWHAELEAVLAPSVKRKPFLKRSFSKLRRLLGKSRPEPQRWVARR
jgi:hypothetical protein